ncbi:hypothetical protein [Mangrovibacterium lignilyticum]|uniref:hypothetical protein n=1 Tax=Mangrovibacterium lignilyticum TaxID=2668052 RepID=UPI0013D40A87|nr:hypothetical protein [Mangrovibacterium lignilyticum]
MKKRDYYILAILGCLIVYAALHRRSFAEQGVSKIDTILKQNQNTEALSSAKDSLKSENLRFMKAEI